MADLTPVVSAVVLALQTPSYAASAPEDRQAVEEGIGAAVSQATCNDAGPECVPFWPASRAGELVSLLVVLARFESGLNPRIGFGHCRPDECDAVKLPGGRVQHLAYGFWQIHRTGLARPDEWKAMRGRDASAVEAQARIAIRTLAGSVNQCRNSGAPRLRAAISGFATGGRCWWTGAIAREKVVWRMLPVANGELGKL